MVTKGKYSKENNGYALQLHIIGYFDPQVVKKL